MKIGVDTLRVEATAGGCRMMLVTRLTAGLPTVVGSFSTGDVTLGTCESGLATLVSSGFAASLA